MTKILNLNLKKTITEIYTYILNIRANYYIFQRWVDFLLPLYIKKFWKQQQEDHTILFIVSTFVLQILQKSFFFCKRFISFIYLAIIYTILYYWNLGRYVYIISGGYFFTTQIRFFINVFLYVFIFLFNFYLLWSLVDLWFILNKNINSTASSNTLWHILYSDFTPYSIFEDKNIFTLGRRLYYKLGFQGKIPLLDSVDLVHANTYYIYQYSITYILLLLFLILIHTLKRVKHLFDDYLRDIDPLMTTIYYYSFCAISLFFYFGNILQLTEYVINFFSIENIIIFFSIYFFFFFLYGIVYLYTLLITNPYKKTLFFNFIYYFLILFIILFCYIICDASIRDTLLKLYLDLTAILQDGKTHNYLIFYENTLPDSDKYLTFTKAKQRALYVTLLTRS